LTDLADDSTHRIVDARPGVPGPRALVAIRSERPLGDGASEMVAPFSDGGGVTT